MFVKITVLHRYCKKLYAKEKTARAGAKKNILKKDDALLTFAVLRTTN